MKRKPKPMEISKEWCQWAAAIEAEWGGDVSAGKPIFYPPEITGWTPPNEPKAKPARKPKTRAASRTAKPVRKRRTTTTKKRGLGVLD